MAKGAERKKYSWLTEGAAILFLLFAVYLLVTNVNPTRRNLVELRRANEKIDRQIESLRQELNRLNLDAKAMANDPFAVENALRNRLRITRPGEKIIRLDPSEKQARQEGMFETGR